MGRELTLAVLVIASLQVTCETLPKATSRTGTPLTILTLSWPQPWQPDWNGLWTPDEVFAQQQTVLQTGKLLMGISWLHDVELTSGCYSDKENFLSNDKMRASKNNPSSGFFCTIFRTSELGESSSVLAASEVEQQENRSVLPWETKLFVHIRVMSSWAEVEDSSKWETHDVLRVKFQHIWSEWIDFSNVFHDMSWELVMRREWRLNSN